MVTITYFVHGTTTDNEDELATGWLPGELSATGIEQSKQLGQQVSGQKFDIVFCSDLKRAVDSAQLAFGNTYQIIQDDRLREANYGDWNGMPNTFKENLSDYIDTPFPNGESFLNVQTRMESFCAFLKALYDGKHVAIVAHQAPQLALDVIVGGKSWPQAFGEDWRRTGKWQPGWQYELR
ncbi:MAG TPA: histidine phosphatase family protein [Patescibacteria group bacterium]|nr:histidine phosphatase family protein [Patescibacteria group bacterium]